MSVIILEIRVEKKAINFAAIAKEDKQSSKIKLNVEEKHG